MKTIIKGLENGLSITESLVLLLKNIGYYSFNRFMARNGFSIGYTLAIHRMKGRK